MREVSEVQTESRVGLASGIVVGILLVLVVLAVAAFVFYGGAFRPSAAPVQPSNPANIQVNPPAVPPRVDVNVPPAPAPKVDVNVPRAPEPSKP